MTLELQTPRLLLRPLAPSDFEAHAAMMMDERVAALLTADGKPQALSAEWRSFAMLLGHWAMRGFGFFSVFERESGQWVGRVGPWAPEGWPGIECGWSVAPEHWGKGYAGEAAIAAIAWIFAQKPELSRIISVIPPTNENSRRVAAKIGETLSGEVFRHAIHGDLDIWAAGRGDWLARFG